MKNFLFALLLGSAAFLVACSEEEPVIDPIIGQWELDDVEWKDLPSNFASWEGPQDDVYGEDDYVIEFREDGTYERELSFPGQDAEDEGEYTNDGDELELDPDDDIGLETDYDVININDSEMELETVIAYTLLSDPVQDAYFDTASEDKTQEEFLADLEWLYDNYGEAVDVTVNMVFDRD